MITIISTFNQHNIWRHTASFGLDKFGFVWRWDRLVCSESGYAGTCLVKEEKFTGTLYRHPERSHYQILALIMLRLPGWASVTSSRLFTLAYLG